PGMTIQWDDAPAPGPKRTQTVHDDAGRAFYCEPSEGLGTSLSVRIQPENVLVVADNIHPELPPEVVPGCALPTIERYREWRSQAPEVLVPGTGIPISGEDVIRILDRSIAYLEELHGYVKVAM